MTASSVIAAPADIELKLQRIAGQSVDDAVTQLAAHGLCVGATVHSIYYGRDQGYFRLTRIAFGSTEDPRISFYGYKFRRNGTFGDHEHYISGTEGLTVHHKHEESAA